MRRNALSGLRFFSLMYVYVHSYWKSRAFRVLLATAPFGLLWRSMRFPGIICRVFGNTLFGAYAIRRAVMPYHYNIT